MKKIFCLVIILFITCMSVSASSSGSNGDTLYFRGHRFSAVSKRYDSITGSLSYETVLDLNTYYHSGTVSVRKFISNDGLSRGEAVYSSSFVGVLNRSVYEYVINYDNFVYSLAEGNAVFKDYVYLSRLPDIEVTGSIITYYPDGTADERPASSLIKITEGNANIDSFYNFGVLDMSYNILPLSSSGYYQGNNVPEPFNIVGYGFEDVSIRLSSGVSFDVFNVSETVSSLTDYVDISSLLSADGRQATNSYTLIDVLNNALDSEFLFGLTYYDFLLLYVMFSVFGYIVKLLMGG